MITIGRIVLYTLTIEDAERINRRRAHAQAHMAEHQQNATGVQVHVGNKVVVGEEYPMIVTRVWDQTGCVNGQVLLDGNDLFWATSIRPAGGGGEYTNQRGYWRWPYPQADVPHKCEVLLAT